MGSLDRTKLRIVQRHTTLGPSSRLLDVGCGSGSFLARVKQATGAAVAGVDFVDLSHRNEFDGVEFHHGVFNEQHVGRDRFDVITMWHFLEHDYDPPRTLETARRALRPEGRLVIEVPRLDSVSFRLYRERWPGLQAPQHTACYTRATLLRLVRAAGFEVVDYLPYGAFPAYFYLFAGLAFKLLRGRGLDLGTAIYPYFAGQLALTPLLLFERRLNLAMQTVICRRSP
jgi:SAM-dependent methyltransferase